MSIKKVVAKDEIAQVESGVQIRNEAPEAPEDNQLWYQDDTREAFVRDTTDKLFSQSFVQSERDYSETTEFNLLLEDNPNKYINTISGFGATWTYGAAFLEDDSVIVGGDFTSYGGNTRNRLVKIKKDGTEDTDFYTNLGSGFNSGIFNVTKLSSGNLLNINNILITGAFTTFNGNTRNRIVKLVENGIEDVNFYTNLGTGFNNQINLGAVCELPDGRILVGGNFTDVNGESLNRICMLNSDGTLDTTFNTALGTGFNNSVSTIYRLSNGSFLIGGNFTSFNGNTRNRLVYIDSDGVENTQFYENLGKTLSGGAISAGFNSNVYSIEEVDDFIYIAGAFTSVNGVTQNRISRVFPSGLLDTTFYGGIGSAFNNDVRYIKYLAKEDCFIVTGNFTSFDGYTANRTIFLNKDGSIRNDFQKAIGSGFNNQVISVGYNDYDKLAMVGTFTTLDGSTRNRISFVENMGGAQLTWGNDDISSLLLANGGLNLDLDIISIEEDSDFYTNLGTAFNGLVEIVKRQADGKILIGGTFTSFNGVTRNRLVRINEDGTDDTLFNPVLGSGFTNNVLGIAIQSDGKIIVVGAFTSFNGNTRNRITRLNTDGTEDAAFYTNLGTAAGGLIREVQLQSDGKILLFGEFTTFNGNTRNRITRLNTDGTEDATFVTNVGTGASGLIDTADVDENDKIIIGGNFTSFDGVSINSIARLNSDGTLDTAFNTNLGTAFSTGGQYPFSIRRHRDGYIVGGNFTAFNGSSRIRLIRLDNDGNEDTNFYVNLGNGFNNNTEYITVSSDGKIFVGGVFTIFNTKSCKYFVRLNPDGTEDFKFNAALRQYSANYTTIEFNSRAAHVLEHEGSYVIVGNFTSIDSLSRNYIVKYKEVVDGSAPDKTVYIFARTGDTAEEVFVQTSIKG